MKKYVIGNWKSNKSLKEAIAWLQTFEMSAVLHQAITLEIVICPPALYLGQMHEQLPDLTLGAQTVSAYPNGAYTGAVSAQQLAQWVKYVIVGHAERRKYFAEDASVIAQQVRQALDAQITPIIAVDDQNWMSLLSQFSQDELQKSLVMYEPPTAISTSTGGKAADLDDVLSAIKNISEQFTTKGILYGGSVSPENVSEYMKQPQVAGVVPGAASLEVETFIRLLAQATSAAREAMT